MATKKGRTVRKGKIMKKNIKHLKNVKKSAGFSVFSKKVTPKAALISLFAVIFAFIGINTLVSHAAKNGCTTHGSTTICNYRNVGNGTNGTSGADGTASYSGQTSNTVTNTTDGNSIIVNSGSKSTSRKVLDTITA